MFVCVYVFLILGLARFYEREQVYAKTKTATLPVCVVEKQINFF